VTAARRRVLVAASILALALEGAPAGAVDVVAVWHPERPRVGDAAWLHVLGVPERAGVDVTVDGRPVASFAARGRRVALVGFDLESPAGARPWRIVVTGPGGRPDVVAGVVEVAPRQFPVQRLTLPPAMVDLDPDVERRAVAEAEILGAVFRGVTPERLWQGRFLRPLPGAGRGTGFGARRVLNDQPRMPHGGNDYAAPRGTPVLAANEGRVALVGDFFFPGRLVVLDHGLGVYTLYFHLAEVTIGPGQRVGRGQPLGTVGATGRATGPHLHFGAHVGAARIDPEVLLDLPGE
jgi:murein DD-endopeptidase MepM/ murein hydrolase activator NlpD